MSITRLRVATAVLIAIAATAVTGTAADKEGAGFDTSLAAGVALTDGNSETLQSNASITTEGEKEGLGSIRAGAEGNYGESTVDDETETTVENGKAFLNIRKTLSEKTFALFDTSVLYDDIAEVDYRITAGPGLGYYLVKEDDLEFSVEAGAAYLWEDVAGETADYVVVRFAERITHDVSETCKVWQSAEFLPEAEDFSNYLLTAEAGIECAINSSVNLRLVVQDKYDSEPGDDLEQNDLTVIGGLSVSL